MTDNNQKLADLLQDHSVTRIVFRFDQSAVQLTPELWHQAATAVRSGAVRLLEAFDVGAYGAKFGLYFPDYDQLAMRNTVAGAYWSPHFRCTLVHESVHMINDMRVITLTALENEASAWLTMIAYLYHGGLLSFAFSLPLTLMAPKVVGLATSIIEDYELGRASDPVIPAERWRPLGLAIEASRPSYAGISAAYSVSNGVGAGARDH